MTYLDVLNNTSQRQPNTMAAGISSMILHIRKENIKQSLSDLNTIGHRQQYIATINGVMYYDDSRAENVNATWFTFENIISPVIWIAGGNGSGSDFSDLKRIAKKKKVKALICRDIKDIYEADSLKNAVNMAALMAKADDIVLFSPACKSDNEKETYIERGNQYLETVKQLENERHQ